MGFYGLVGTVSEYQADSAAPGIEAALALGFTINSMLGLRAEAIFSPETAVFRRSEVDKSGDEEWVYTVYSDTYRWTSMALPLMLRLGLPQLPFGFFLLGGIYAILPLGTMEAENTWNQSTEGLPYSFGLPLGITGGLELEFPLGPGALTLGIRYAGDLGKLMIERLAGMEIRRSRVSFFSGYEMEFFRK
jgi:hypothetical protein